jgi:predicted nucleic acid-binding protein
LISTRIVIDSNLLLLWIAGLSGADIVKRHRRLQRYESRHVGVLAEILAPFQGLVVTPHCLAEFWNLIGETRGGWDQDREILLAATRALIGEAVEIYHPTKELLMRKEITWLGLADVSQISAAVEGGFALTSSDGPLCGQASALGIPTHHFWQIAEGR